MVADTSGVGDLVTPDDLAKFEEGDAEFFLRASEKAVRTYCGWHISPVVTVTNGKFEIGRRGLIVLPSLFVTDVASVSIDGRVLDTSAYDWDPAGFITRRFPSWGTEPYARVTFTHGYAETPHDVQTVILEIASAAMELPASRAKDITAGPFRLTLNGTIGVDLSKSQQDRLASYRIQGVA